MELREVCLDVRQPVESLLRSSYKRPAADSAMNCIAFTALFAMWCRVQLSASM